jgi:hypothetical protein
MKVVLRILRTFLSSWDEMLLDLDAKRAKGNLASTRLYLLYVP